MADDEQVYAGIAWARVESVPRSGNTSQAQLQPAVLALLIAADERPIPGEFTGSCEIEYAARNPSYAEQPAKLMSFQEQVEEGSTCSSPFAINRMLPGLSWRFTCITMRANVSC